MPAPSQEGLLNLLLRRLAPDDYALLSAELEPVKCGRGEWLFGRNVPLYHLWFFERGVGSLVITSPDGQRIEAGLFGRDGFAPTALIHGADGSPYDCLIQIPGDAHRLPVGVLRKAMERSAAVRDTLLRYAGTLLLQTSCTALSNAVHQLDERLARWLLMCHDRSDGDELALTHEVLSVMLAVRRPSITTALHVLEGNGFIHAERGWITIRDRAGMEEFAADAYGMPEREYERLLGPLR